jgi:hypothetical protein
LWAAATGLAAAAAAAANDEKAIVHIAVLAAATATESLVLIPELGAAAGRQAGVLSQRSATWQLKRPAATVVDVI